MDYWPIEKISDKNKLLSFLVLNVPLGSLWQADGINDESIAIFLEKYLTENCKEKWYKLGNSEKDFFEVELKEGNKDYIANEVLNWDLENNLNTQTIIYSQEKYLESYDYLDESCTWISRKIDLGSLKGVIELEGLNN